MHVLAVSSMYPPQHLGGYELVLQGAVRAMRAAGHEVTVLTTDTSLREAPEEDDGVHRTLRWWWAGHAFPRRSLRERLAVERHNAAVLREFDADVVTWWAMGGMTLSLLGLRTLPSVGVVHDDWLLYGPQVDQRPKVLSSHDGIERVGEWLFVSQFVRARAMQRGALPRDARTTVAPSGIAAALVDAGPAPARDWGGRLLVVGRIDERKGIDTAIEALALGPREATLTVVGEGDLGHLAALRELAAARGVASRVRFAGAMGRDTLRDVYAGHDAVLFPVRWDEPWGLVPLEAMACGRPVVATGRGGSGEYLRDGENALLAAADDVAGFAAALGRLAGDAALRATVRSGGLETAAGHTEDRFHAAVLAAVERAAASAA